MYSKATLVSLLAAVAEARFGQEQVPIAAINALTAGSPGAAATLAGSAVSTLLAAANPCAKLQKADDIITQLGTGADVIAAARGLVAAEQNFNPFVVSIPAICSDASLPVSEQLRGVIPLVDPSVGGADAENTASKSSLTTPFDATGLSVAQIMVAQGFSNFTTEALDGTKGTAADLSGSASAGTAATSSAAAVVASSSAASSASAVATTFATVVSSASTAAATSSSSTSSVQQSSISGLDFGLCVPTMKFEAGLDGRSDTEFTFQAIDPLVNKGQEEALNPNIITNRICDQLTNVCNANDAAIQACDSAQSTIEALGTKDVTTAEKWNSLLGFEGVSTNPDNAPQAGLVGHS